MFYRCQKLKEIKGINNFKTSKVTNMKGMFFACISLESLDLSNFDTSNVTNMNVMLNFCLNLKEIKGINKFITDKVVILRGMFGYCKNLEHLDLSNFNTSNVTDMDICLIVVII